MAAPMAVAAALGFFGSKATAFVSSPAATSSAPITHAAAGYQPTQQPAAGASTGSALCAGVALGFAGAATTVRASRSRTAAAAFDPTSTIGAFQPMGFWDPCGLMKERVGKDGAQWKDQETFDKYRTAELKHGRVAMMAAVGMITTTVWKFPGFGDIPDGLAALNTTTGGSGFGILFIMAAYFEITTPKGDFDVPGPWTIDDEMKTKELANGRLAMAAVITLLITEYGVGDTPAQQFAATLSDLMGSSGFYTAWALLVLGFAWTQQDGVNEINWSSKNFLYSKGLGPKPEALKPIKVAVSAKLPAPEPEPALMIEEPAAAVA